MVEAASVPYANLSTTLTNSFKGIADAIDGYQKLKTELNTQHYLDQLDAYADPNKLEEARQNGAIQALRQSYGRYFDRAGTREADESRLKSLQEIAKSNQAYNDFQTDVAQRDDVNEGIAMIAKGASLNDVANYIQAKKLRNAQALIDFFHNNREHNDKSELTRSQADNYQANAANTRASTAGTLLENALNKYKFDRFKESNSQEGVRTQALSLASSGKFDDAIKLVKDTPNLIGGEKLIEDIQSTQATYIKNTSDNLTLTKNQEGHAADKAVAGSLIEMYLNNFNETTGLISAVQNGELPEGAVITDPRGKPSYSLSLDAAKALMNTPRETATLDENDKKAVRAAVAVPPIKSSSPSSNNRFMVSMGGNGNKFGVVPIVSPDWGDVSEEKSNKEAWDTYNNAVKAEEQRILQERQAELDAERNRKIKLGTDYYNSLTAWGTKTGVANQRSDSQIARDFVVDGSDQNINPAALFSRLQQLSTPEATKTVTNTNFGKDAANEAEQQAQGLHNLSEDVRNSPLGDIGKSTEELESKLYNVVDKLFPDPTDKETALVELDKLRREGVTVDGKHYTISLPLLIHIARNANSRNNFWGATPFFDGVWDNSFKKYATIYIRHNEKAVNQINEAAQNASDLRYKLKK